MDGMIKCSVCGENNSSELDYCQKCNSRLRLQDESLKPGELPDKRKNTAELEPILPQWLRDAREQSRQTSDDDLSAGMQSPKSHSPGEPAAPNVDFLAGLGSHADDDNEDETPDWLASITGVSNKPKKSGTETSDVRWVEMGGKDDFAQDVPAQDADNDTPSWLANIQAQPKTEKDELTDWFKEAANPAQDSGWLDQSEKKNDFMSQDSELVSSSDSPDWLRQMQADDSAKNETVQPAQSFSSNEDTPDWLKSMGSDDSAQSSPIQVEPTFDSGDDAPDWLKRMDEKESAKPAESQGFSINDDVPAWLQQPGTQGPADDDVPSWLNAMDAQQKSQPVDPAPFAESSTGGNDAGFLSTDDAPDWLKNAQAEEPKASPLKGTSPLWLRDNSEADSADVPAWLSPNPVVGETPPAASIFDETKQEDAGADDNIPSWLKAAAPQSSIFSEPEVEQPQSFSSDTPDWLSAFKSVEGSGSQPSSPFSNDIQAENDLPAPAFTENSFESLGDNALFTEMPDWLSNAADTPAVDASPSVNNADSLAAGELPSWVQAMRPVDPGSRPGSSSPIDQTLESRGALAGLQGVLPSVPGFSPSSKPKAYSILLQATEEQKSHALLLEQILSAEAEPQPIASYAPLAASRPLRWFIAAILLAVVTTVLALGTQWFTMPVLSMNTPNELSGALTVAQNVPEGAPILVVMDYRPSHAAELEAAAAPMLDQMDLLKHPKLVFVSTNEMGPILTQRLFSLPALAGRFGGEGQFTNLGYLPGGELGIRAFVQNPLQTMPSDIFRNPAPLQPGISITQFVAVLILTDNADSGRIWIEQATAATAPLPFPAPIVLITSAQAGPMIQPYYASGQVKGIVNGLYGSAIFEQNNANRPGTARSYWDAYSIGMLFAMLMLVLGGLWNLALGVRDRSAARGAI
jgi:hypothetical protein